MLFNFVEEEDEDAVHLLTCDTDGNWIKVSPLNMTQSKNRDVVSFEIEQFISKYV